MSRRSSESKAWKDFEERVGDALQAQGYAVVRDTLVATRQSDLVVERAIGGTSVRILVECRHHATSRRVGVPEVEAFLDRVRNARATGLIDKGYLVTNTGFSSGALPLLEAHHATGFVSLLTEKTLAANPLDFTAYARRMIDEFHASDLSTYLVDLTCSSYLAGMDDTGEKQTHDSVMSYVLNWIDDGEGRQLCILGNYGTGKTSFCRALAVALAENYLANPLEASVPVLIPLREYNRARSFRFVVTDWLVNECGIAAATFAAFRTMNDLGRCVLILDGFDEMHQEGSLTAAYDAFFDLASLRSEAGRVIVTGRPGYFPDIDTLERMTLGIAEPEETLPYRGFDAATWHIEPAVMVDLHPLDRDQVMQIIDARRELYESRGLERADLLKVIQRQYDLLDLATRPVLLDVIIRTYADLGERFTILNTADLYRRYTDLWIRRDPDRGLTRQKLSSNAVRAIMEAIAWTMFIGGRMSIHHTEVADFTDLGVADSELDTEEFGQEIRTCYFLSPGEDGSFRFAHKSFMEFFCASFVHRILAHLSKEVEETSPVTLEAPALGYAILSDEVLIFTTELILLDPTIDESILYRLFRSERSDQGRSSRERTRSRRLQSNTFALMMRLHDDYSGNDFTGCWLEGIDIPEGRSLFRCDLTDSVLRNVRARRLSIREGTLNRAQIERCDFAELDAQGAGISDTIVAASSFAGASFANARVDGCRFTQRTTLRAVDFQDATLTRVALADADLQEASFVSSRLYDTDLRRADLREVDWTGAHLERVDLDRALADKNIGAATLIDCVGRPRVARRNE